MSLIEKAIAQLEQTSGPGNPKDLRGVFSLKPAAVLDCDKVASIAAGARFEPIASPLPGASASEPVPESVAFSQAFELPLASLKEHGFLTPEARATVTGREFRMIKGPLLEKAYGTEAQRVPNGHCIVVTSALPGEGKTFCAINLAISMAVTGRRRVMLIDADVAQPSIAKHLGLEDRQGLIDLLTGREPDPRKIVLQSSIPGLSIIPAGQVQQHAGEYLASQEMATLMDRLSADYPETLIIIDTPPLLAVTETRAVVQRAGQTLLVVAAGSTKRGSVNAALAAVAGSSSISMILNKLPTGKSEFGSYYEY